MLIDNYFKAATENIFYGRGSSLDLDFDQMFPVENTHYWNDFYTEISDRCVFIDYPDHAQPYIMNIYLEKVFNNDVQKMLDYNLLRQNSYIASKANINNIKEILNIQWLKNLKSWRQNYNMSSINLADFFDQARLKNIVETLINEKIRDSDRFDSVYNNWCEKNKKLKNLFLT